MESRMILIADSGSTGTSWVLTDFSNYRKDFEGAGMNPNYSSEKELKESLSLLPFDSDKVSKIYFYGSGVGSEENNRKVSRLISQRFQKAEVFVANDLLAAAKALSPENPGIIGILGTGTNSCYWDGERISDDQHSLGFLLGDEGSGFDFGKHILSAFFYNQLSQELSTKFRGQYQLDRSLFITELYQQTSPNRYIAAFAPFVFENSDFPEMKKLIQNRFNHFIKYYLMRFQSLDLPVHFIGSVAYFGKPLLEDCLRQAGFSPGAFLRQPMDGLLQYHKIKHNI